MKRALRLLSPVLVALLALSCSREHDNTEIRFVIGVAQANLSEPWRTVMNDEIESASKSYSGVKIVFTNASDSWEKQAEDIEHLIHSGIDLLIVSPVESREIAAAIRDAYAIMPVIVLDKAIEGYDYSLFIGVDNYLVGKQAARFIKEFVGAGRGKVVELTGKSGSLTVAERMQGFRAELRDSGNIILSASFSADWLRDKAHDLTLERPGLFADSTVVFAHNDAMALGVHRGLTEARLGKKTIIGIDGLTGVEGGLSLVADGILEATIICPTGGKVAVDRAMDILMKRDGLPKKIFLRSSIVTHQILAEIRSHAPRNFTRNPGAPVVLGYAQTGRESAWREANTKSIISAAKNSGITLLFRDAELDQAKQIEAIREFIRKGVDVIAFSPLVETGWDEVLHEAKMAGIPVICSDRSVAVADETLVATYLGADFIEEGRRAAQWVLNETAGRQDVRIVELRGLPGSAPAIDREKGFAEVIKRSESYSIIDSEPGDFIRKLGYEVMTQFLHRNQRIDVVYAHNDDMALGAIRAIEEAGLRPAKDILIVSIDGVKAAFQAMVKGKLNCSVECSPLLGPQLMKAVLDYVRGEDLPYRINTEEGVFTMENAKNLIGSRPY